MILIINSYLEFEIWIFNLKLPFVKFETFDTNSIFFKFPMQLRYSGNIMPFEDSMKKVSAITWASSGKKLAVAAADRVTFPHYSVCLSFRLKWIEKRQVPNKALRQRTKILLNQSLGVFPWLLQNRCCSKRQHRIHLQDRSRLGGEKSNLQQIPCISLSNMHDLAKRSCKRSRVWFGWRKSSSWCVKIK